MDSAKRTVLLLFGWAVCSMVGEGRGITLAALKPAVAVTQSGPGDRRGSDETPILQAIARLGKDGGVVTIGPGNYVVRRSIRLTSDVTLRGSEGTVLRLPPASIVKAAASRGQSVLSVADTSPFAADTLVEIVPPPAEGPSAVEAKACLRVKIKQVTPGQIVLAEPLARDVPAGSFAGYPHSLFVIGGAQKNIRIEKLTLEGGRKPGVSLPGHTERCALLAEGAYSYQGGPSGLPVENVQVADCRIRNFYGRAVAWYSVVRSKVTGCQIEEIADESVDLDHFCYHCEVTDNVIRRGVTGVTINDGSYCTVARNRIEQCGVGITVWWWHMCPQTDIDVENVVRDNVILSPRGDGISLGKRCFRNQVSGNTVEGGIRVAEPDNRVEKNIEIRNVAGRVTGDGKPLAGVLVSDGGRVVRTDAEGRYKLGVGPDSGPFVFVSTPAGFWTEAFFVPAAKAAAAGRADFVLRAVPQPKRFDFVFVTDVHLENRKAGVPKFRASLLEINALKPTPAFLWSQGDICLQGHSGDVYAECLKLAKMPVRNGPGNHEMMLDHKNPRDDFQRLFGPTYYSFDWGGIHCVMLDGNKPIPGGKDWKAVHGAVEGSELARLRADLAAQPKDRPTVVGIHIPIVTTYPQRRKDNSPDAPYWEVTNRDVLTDLFAAHGVRLVLQGHMHENERASVKGVEYVASISVSGSWWNAGKGMERGVDGAPRGYRIVSVDGTQITHRYYSSCESHVDRRGEWSGLEKPLPANGQVGLVFNGYDAPNGSTAQARFDQGPWLPMPAFPAMGDPKIGLVMPHHFRVMADTKTLGLGRHTVAARVRWPDGTEVTEEGTFTVADRGR